MMSIKIFYMYKGKVSFEKREILLLFPKLVGGKKYFH